MNNGTVPADEVTRAYKFKMAPNKQQEAALYKHVAVARASYNFALAKKIKTHRLYSQLVAEHTYTNTLEPLEALKKAKKEIKLKIPSSFDSSKELRAEKEWYSEYDTHAWMSGMRRADIAWKNWIDSVTGRRAGPKVGYPKFKSSKVTKYGSFSLFHDRKKPSLRFMSSRKFNLPKKVGGAVRLEANGRLLRRKILKGKADVSSVTISYTTSGWWLSVTVTETVLRPSGPSKKQRSVGAVGVDMGVKVLMALSDGSVVNNPRHLNRAQKKLTKAQRELSRKGWYRNSDGKLISGDVGKTPRSASANRVKAQRKVAKQYSVVALRRSGFIHELTKRLTTCYAVVAIEDLNVSGMLRSSKGTAESPGKNVRAKAGLSKSISDASFGEIRRQLEYKSKWYGSKVCVVDRWLPSSKTCSSCGSVKPTLALSDRLYNCSECGMIEDRDVNAAKNILNAATVSD